MMTDKPAVLDANQVRDLIDEVLRWRAESRARTASGSRDVCSVCGAALHAPACQACETVFRRPKDSLSRVLLDVTTERMMQDRKFGAERDIPSVPDLATEDLRCNVLGVIPERVAKSFCEHAFHIGRGTWAHILVEEAAEAIAAPDDVARRAELVQCAAVCVAWCENIDRRGAK